MIIINILRVAIVVMMLSYCNQSSVKNDVATIDKIIIKKVDFSILTFVTVKCEDFEKQFKDKYTVSTIIDIRDIKGFMEIFKDSIRLDSSFDNYIVDTRAKTQIHYNDGKVLYICIGNPAYKRDGVFYHTSDSIKKYIENIEPD